ncbi:MAG: HAD family hydrolase [Rhodobacteraceae bacterium]|nr:HAD family hydrolase [Paracoccaceae bacterium]
MIDALVFDKDGTLYDFSATFSDWAVKVLEQFAPDAPAQQKAMADVLRFDLATRAFHDDSPVIAGTNREVAGLLVPFLPALSLSEIELQLIESSAEAPLAEAVPLARFLDGLRGRGLGLAVMTNDGEAAARAQLGRSGVAGRFDVILGADSGHGGKPDAAPLLAACAAMGVAPQRSAMVGDSTHDLIAGRAAGMCTIGVLTGMAPHEVLAPFADVVLPDIGHLPGWLDRSS